MVRFLLAAGVWCLVLAAASAQAPAEVRTETDVVFGKGGDRELKLDLAMPRDGDGPFPAVVCVHGGGWVGGDRKQMAATILVLARRGFVAVTPDYRTAPADRFPAQLEDCKAPMRSGLTLYFAALARSQRTAALQSSSWAGKRSAGAVR